MEKTDTLTDTSKVVKGCDRVTENGAYWQGNKYESREGKIHFVEGWFPEEVAFNFDLDK